MLNNASSSGCAIGLEQRNHSAVTAGKSAEHLVANNFGGQVPISPNCVFDASLVPGTCPARFLDLKGLINKFLESRVTGKVKTDVGLAPHKSQEAKSALFFLRTE